MPQGTYSDWVTDVEYDWPFTCCLFQAVLEDGTDLQTTCLGPFHHKLLRALLPFWSVGLPTLPVTAPPHKDVSNTDDVPEGRLCHRRPSRMDLREILIIIAIMACLATMVIVYYRLAQRSLDENQPNNEQQ